MLVTAGLKSPLKLIGRIISVLSANLLHPDVKPSAIASGHLLAGHCYTVAEVLYHLWGKKNNFDPFQVEVKDPLMGTVSHWYLCCGTTVIDPTKGQFSREVPYPVGKRRAFITRKPSRRAQEVIRRLKVKL